MTLDGAGAAGGSSNVRASLPEAEALPAPLPWSGFSGCCTFASSSGSIVTPGVPFGLFVAAPAGADDDAGDGVVVVRGDVCAEGGALSLPVAAVETELTLSDLWL